MADELQQKIAKLPSWAREHITQLERRSAPAVEEARRQRNEAERAKDAFRNVKNSNEALLEILRCAGKGGSDWAATVVKVLEGYEIYQPNTKGQES